MRTGGAFEQLQGIVAAGPGTGYHRLEPPPALEVFNGRPGAVHADHRITAPLQPLDQRGARVVARPGHQQEVLGGCSVH
jgi:hypothetical protein